MPACVTDLFSASVPTRIPLGQVRLPGPLTSPTQPTVEHLAQRNLRFGVAQVRRFLKPLFGELVVQTDAASVQVHRCELILRIHASTAGCDFVQLARAPEILFDAHSARIGVSLQVGVLRLQ